MHCQTAGVLRQVKRGEVRCVCDWIAAGEEGIEQNTQAVNIALRRCLRTAILFRGSIARRTKQLGIMRLAVPEVTSDAKAYQGKLAGGVLNDIAGLEVAKDDGRLPGM